MKKRILTIALVVALLATCFAGTYAYLQDTKAQLNTFTSGKVEITLDEAVVEKNANGNLVAKEDESRKTAPEGQSYHLFPNMTVTKDPTITLNAGSEDAWIAAKITFTGYNAKDLLSGGVMFGDTVTLVDAGNVLYVYVKGIQKAGAEIVLFDTLEIPATWTNTEMAAINDMTINVEAYAVQANGFADCQAAMKAAFPGAFN